MASVSSKTTPAGGSVDGEKLRWKLAPEGWSSDDEAYNAALVPSSPEMKPGLVAVGSATVAVSQAAMRRGHVVYNNCALYMLLVIVQTVPWLLCILL